MACRSPSPRPRARSSGRASASRGSWAPAGGGTTVRNLFASETPYGEVAVGAALAAAAGGLPVRIVNVGDAQRGGGVVGHHAGQRHPRAVGPGGQEGCADLAQGGQRDAVPAGHAYRRAGPGARHPRLFRRLRPQPDPAGTGRRGRRRLDRAAVDPARGPLSDGGGLSGRAAAHDHVGRHHIAGLRRRPARQAARHHRRPAGGRARHLRGPGRRRRPGRQRL